MTRKFLVPIYPQQSDFYSVVALPLLPMKEVGQMATLLADRHWPLPSEVPFNDWLDTPQTGPELDRWVKAHLAVCPACRARDTED